MALKPIVMPRDNTVSDREGKLTQPYQRLLSDLVDRKAETVTLTGTASTDIAAIRQALIDAGLMKGS